METLGRRAALAGLLGLAGTAHAQHETYPNRLIRFVVGFPAGGVTDVAARLMAEEMDKVLGQRIVVDNRGGASGSIGAAVVAKSPPDGYTLYFAIASHTILPATMGRHLQYDTTRDFAAISQISSSPNMFVVRTDSRIRTLQDLVDAARQAPGKISYSTPGYGTTTHLTAALFEQAANIKLMHVPYKSSVNATEAVVNGEVDFGSSSILGGGAGVRQGRYRPLAVVGDARLAVFPDIPTFRELGYANVLGDSWMGLLAPAGTPVAIIGKLHDAVVRIIASPTIATKLLEMGAIAVTSTPEQFQKRIEEEVSAFRALGEKVPLTSE